jgi:DNA invertase Pin-like site-specific DNA recombinase
MLGAPIDVVARVREMKAEGLGPTAIAKALGIGRASVYRVLEAN